MNIVLKHEFEQKHTQFPLTPECIRSARTSLYQKDLIYQSLSKVVFSQAKLEKKSCQIHKCLGNFLFIFILT